MDAFIKPIVHGTHHAMEQICCANGFCFGLPNFTKQVLVMANVPKNIKRLLLHLTGYSKSKLQDIWKDRRGLLMEKSKRQGKHEEPLEGVKIN